MNLSRRPPATVRLCEGDRARLRRTIARLTAGEDRTGAIAEELRPHLDALRLYLDTWVVPDLADLLRRADETAARASTKPREVRRRAERDEAQAQMDERRTEDGPNMDGEPREVRAHGDDS